MGKEQDGEEKNMRARRRNPAAAVLSIVSTLLLSGLVLVSIPLTVPRVFGYQIYYVVSGSMEPAVPVGSLVYVKETPGEEMEEGDIAAFYGAGDQGSVITHRVVENRKIIGELVTKGDANPTEDMEPVPYGDLIGKAAYTVPVMGRVAEAFTSQAGKAAAGSGIGAALFMQALAGWIDRRSRSGSRA